MLLRSWCCPTSAQCERRRLTYLRDTFPNARFVDPANTNNVISDDLRAAEKQRISAAAGQALNGSWEQFVR